MKFPALVYRCPGDHQMPGGTYSYLGVKDSDALESAIKDGWFKSLSEAESGKRESATKPEEEKVVEVSDDASPTREELEQQANELKIKYDGRTSDAKLLKLINDKLNA